MANGRQYIYENPLLTRFGAGFFNRLPCDPGVYFFLDSRKKPLYIGKADNLKLRLMSYKRLKPGSAPEHSLEMIERARYIVWELHPSGKAALNREAELLRTVQPPFNIAGTWDLDYPVIAISYPRADAARFVYTYGPKAPEPGSRLRLFGCYADRRKTKDGYLALLRLLYACTSTSSRFYFPARISRPFAPYEYLAKIPRGWRRGIEDFLSGRSPALLRRISLELLNKDTVPPFLYHRINEDLATAMAFFSAGPELTRRILKERFGEDPSACARFLEQQELDAILRERADSAVLRLSRQHPEPRALS